MSNVNIKEVNVSKLHTISIQRGFVMNTEAKEDAGQGDYAFDESRTEELADAKATRQAFLVGVPATMQYMCYLDDETGRYDAESELFAVSGDYRNFSYKVTPYKHGTTSYLLVLGGRVLGEVILHNGGE
jgi:hypothetical protein